MYINSQHSRVHCPMYIITAYVYVYMCVYIYIYIYIYTYTHTHTHTHTIVKSASVRTTKSILPNLCPTTYLDTQGDITHKRLQLL